ncbi:MAG TPA: hypothetical protein VN428_19080 [Bryobacteraceae bacterium]|nr:hypothetical protein [Bryobacteraceae bacterium]
MKLRTASFCDYDPVHEVCRRHGMSLASKAVWIRSWEANPHAAAFHDSPPAWLLEADDGRAVGCLINVPRTFFWNGRAIHGAVAGNWIVDPEHRGHSLKLASAFYGQPNLDLLYHSTASATVAKLMPFFKADPLPLPEFGRSLLWAIHPYRVARAAIAKKKWPAASLLAAPAGAITYATAALRISGGRRSVRAVVRLPEFDARFEDFWGRLRAQCGRLVSDRSREVLRLRFGEALADGRMLLVGMGDVSLSGYGLLLIREDRANRLRRGQVIDVQAEPEDDELIAGLIAGLIREAKLDSCDVVEFAGFGGIKQRVAAQLAPHPRTLAHMPFWYRTRAPELAAALKSADAWDPSPFDYD